VKEKKTKKDKHKIQKLLHAQNAAASTYAQPDGFAEYQSKN